MTDTEIRAHGLVANGLVERTIAWAELDRLRLAYFSTRRDRKSGWMQLELAGGGARLSLDSRIAGFGEVVRRAADAAAERHLQVSEATAANLEALGVRVPEWQIERPLMNDLCGSRTCTSNSRPPPGPSGRSEGSASGMRPATTLAVVGESGSGKSVLSQSILRILPRNGAITQGAILFADPRDAGRADRPGASCRPTGARCGRSAAAASRSSFRSR